MTKRFTNEAHVLSGSVRRAIDARGDARGGGVSIPGRTREEPYGFVFGDPGSAAARPGARRGGAASPDPRDWHDGIDPGSMPNFGDQLDEIVKYLPGGGGAGRRSIVGWISGASGRMPSGGPTTGRGGFGAGVPGRTPGRRPGASRIGAHARLEREFDSDPRSADTRWADANRHYEVESAADPKPVANLLNDSSAEVRQAQSEWQGRQHERESTLNKEMRLYILRKTAPAKQTTEPAGPSAPTEEEDPDLPKVAQPNPFDDGGGPVDPRVRGGREAMPNPEGGTPIDPRIRGSREANTGGPAGPSARVALPDPEGDGPVNPWSYAAGATVRRRSRWGDYYPNPEDDLAPDGPSLQTLRALNAGRSAR